MDREQVAELNSLEQRALGMLHGGEWAVFLANEPSFDDCCAVGATRWHHEPELVFRRWQRGADMEKLRSPIERLKHPRELTPTMVERRQKISPERVDVWGRELAAITIGVPSHGLGFATADGVRFTIRAEMIQSTITLSWVACPPEWRSAADWFARTWRAMTSEFGERNGAAFPWERPEGY